MHAKNPKESAPQVSWNARITKYAGLISFGISVCKKPGAYPLLGFDAPKLRCAGVKKDSRHCSYTRPMAAVAEPKRQAGPPMRACPYRSCYWLEAGGGGCAA